MYVVVVSLSFGFYIVCMNNCRPCLLLLRPLLSPPHCLKESSVILSLVLVPLCIEKLFIQSLALVLVK